jgi:hypothetical protein
VSNAHLLTTHGIGRIDASGRIADRAVTGALGWR